MRSRSYSEYAADLKEDSCERQLRGDLRFQIVESIRLTGTHYWQILDLETDLSVCKSCVLSMHETRESAEFTAEVLNAWQDERARQILAADLTEDDLQGSRHCSPWRVFIIRNATNLLV